MAAKVRCHYEECVFLLKGFCSASLIEIDPEDGCLTYSEDPDDLKRIDAFEDTDEDDDDFEDSWDDAGFEELDDLDFDEDDSDF